MIFNWQEMNEIKGGKKVDFVPVLGISVLPIDCHPLLADVLQKEVKFIVSMLLGGQSQLQNRELSLSNKIISIWKLHVFPHGDKYFQTA